MGGKVGNADEITLWNGDQGDTHECDGDYQESQEEFFGGTEVLLIRQPGEEGIEHDDEHNAGTLRQETEYGCQDNQKSIDATEPFFKERYSGIYKKREGKDKRDINIYLSGGDGEHGVESHECC